MNVYQGKSVFGGIAIGHLCVYQKGEQQVTRQKIEDVEAEVKRFQVAREAAQAQLGELYDKAVKEVGRKYHPYAAGECRVCDSCDKRSFFFYVCRDG